MKQGPEKGAVLLAVVLALSLIAAVAMLINRGGGMNLASSVGQEAVDVARAAAEAGLNHAKWQAQHSNCAGYADFTDEPFGSTTYQGTFSPIYSTIINPTSGTPVTIQATGTEQQSGTVREINRLVAIYEPPITEVLQLGADPGKDTILDEFYINRNFGNYRQGVSTDPSWIMRQLIAFDLSGIGTNVKIISARLDLYHNSTITAASDAEITVHGVTRDWVEGTKAGTGIADGATWNTHNGTANWTTAGGDYNPSPAAESEIESNIDQWVEWDITTLVTGWVDGTLPNYGMLLKGNGNLNVGFASKEDADPTLRPKLTITYACECGSGGTSYTLLLQPGADGEDTYLSDGQPTSNYGGEPEIQNSNKTNSKDRGILRFDLSSVPAAAILTSAVLEMNLEGIGSGTPGTAGVHQISTEWQEMQATWNTKDGTTPWSTAGGDFDPVPVDTKPIDPLGGPVTWDVIDLVAGWLNATYENYGMLLLVNDGTNHAKFTSSDSGTEALRPKLTINYTCPCGMDCAPTAPPPEEPCDADFTPLGQVAEFGTTGAGISDIEGIAYLPPGKSFLGWTAPAEGGLLLLNNSGAIISSTLDGTTQGGCAMILPVGTKAVGLTYILDGVWADHLAMLLNEGSAGSIRMIASNCVPQGDLSTHITAPTGIAYIGTTASGQYEGELALFESESDQKIRIKSQNDPGTELIQQNVSGLMGDLQGGAHIPHSDKMLLVDRNGGESVVIVDFVNFTGAALRSYDPSPFGADYPNGAAINLESCDHVLTDNSLDKVVELNIIGVALPPQTVTLNPDADTFMDESDPGVVQGAADPLTLGISKNGMEYRTMIRFDLSSIPGGSTVNQATLRLYTVATKGNWSIDLGVYRITADWDEATASWASTGGGLFNPAVLATTTVPMTLGWQEWSLPVGVVHEWIDGIGVPNYGVLLKFDGGGPASKDKFIGVTSREGLADQQPQLVLEYVEP